MFFHTLITRWYVFVFLVAFLVIGIRTRGVVRTLLFLAGGYLIAWISEASSIRTGFPYGWYFYIYENLRGEWMNRGVPVWDSLSYVFLCFAGLSLSEFVVGKIPPVPPLTKGGWGGFKLALLSALFVLILDLVIDPLAHMGDRWFLGKIYYYPNPGLYFGVPLSNFAGWFLVSFAIVGVNLMLERFFKPSAINHLPSTINHQPSTFPDKYSGPLLYFGIFLFNFAITLRIGEFRLALMDLVWISIPAYLFVKAAKARNQRAESGKRKTD
ncbi:MAG: carotenoid biosynthesis protein [Deltaproteobacteria bacterium]|nr:carotenoid biosynthesis protein [Deltaproteobacteria bacterium]